MKRLPLCIFFLCLLLALPCRAEGTEGLIGELYDGLPSEAVDALPDELSEGLKEEGGTAVRLLDASFFLNFFSTSLQAALGECGEPLLLLFGCVMLAAFLHTLADTAGGESGRAIAFASGLGVTLACFEVIRPLWEAASSLLDTMGLIVKSSLPVMTAIGSASGAVSGTVVHATWLTVLLTLLEQLGDAILSPLLSVCCGFILVCAVSRAAGASDLGGTVRAIRSAFLLFLSLLTTVLVAVMSFQTVLAKSSDSALLRSVRFASGSAIPIIGGALSEAASSYLGSLAVIRSAAGTLVAASLVVAALPLLLRLFFCRMGFSLIATMADILGDGKSSAVVKEAASVLELLLSMMALLSVLFILIAGVFASAATSV